MTLTDKIINHPAAFSLLKTMDDNGCNIIDAIRSVAVRGFNEADPGKVEAKRIRDAIRNA